MDVFKVVSLFENLGLFDMFWQMDVLSLSYKNLGKPHMCDLMEFMLQNKVCRQKRACDAS
jgi:hypothetical protein